MNLLDQIIVSKKREIALKKSIISVRQLEGYELFNSKTTSLRKSIINSPHGIIAEHKRRSPSKGSINHHLSVEEVVIEYESAGAIGISILTDSQYFGGSLEDLIVAKACVQIPLLRKEFIVEEYQIIEAKAHGADAILLIASALTKKQIKQLSELAQSFALEVLCEVHNVTELEKSILPSIDIIGVNNRNLKTFKVNLDISMDLITQIPNDFIKISESGLTTVADVLLLKSCGYTGFLIGENFMKTDNPGKSLEEFIIQLEK